MTDFASLPDSTPILVGAGQVVQHEATDDSPMTLAARAAAAALANAGGQGLAEAIDTVSITRLFTDSMGIPPCPFGRSDNPPMSVARALGAAPAHCIYGQVGGNEPQSRLIEFAADIARGERSVVLLAGAEAMRNQRSAQRAGRELDWSESFDEDAFPLEDRGWGELFVTMQEVHNGLLAAMSYYGLIEQAQATARGRSTAEHREAMAQLLAPFSAVAAANPWAQFPTALAAQEILSAAPLNHLYSKRMVAQDGVNQGAALLLCSVGAARKLGIPAQRWVFLHGLAQGQERQAERARGSLPLDHAGSGAGQRAAAGGQNYGRDRPGRYLQLLSLRRQRGGGLSRPAPEWLPSPDPHRRPGLLRRPRQQLRDALPGGGREPIAGAPRGPRAGDQRRWHAVQAGGRYLLHRALPD